jgi:hypothetical protein
MISPLWRDASRRVLDAQKRVPSIGLRHCKSLGLAGDLPSMSKSIAQHLCAGLYSLDFAHHFSERQKLFYRRPPAAIFFLDDFF